MSEQQTPDREKEIAEIREALRRVEFGTYRITAFADLEYWLRFLLDELEKLEREYAEERAAHNAHVTGLCEAEKQNQQMREMLDEAHELIEQGKRYAIECERLQQERNKLIECLLFYERLARGREVNDGGRRARTLLAEIGVTVE